MWPKFSNCSIFMRELQFCKDLTRKTDFFEGWSWIKFNHLRLVLERVLKFYDNVVKVLELKVRTFWGLIPTFGEVAEEKLIGGGAPAILNRVTESSIALRNIPETSAWFDSFIPSESRSFNKIFFCFPDFFKSIFLMYFEILEVVNIYLYYSLPLTNSQNTVIGIPSPLYNRVDFLKQMVFPFLSTVLIGLMLHTIQDMFTLS